MTPQVATANRVRVAERPVWAAAAAAAGLAGAAEVILQRIAAPVSAHVALPFGGWWRGAGDAAAGATAALVILAAAGLALAARHSHPLVAAALAGGTGATLVAVAVPGTATRLVLYGAVVAGTGLIVTAASGRARRAALGAAGVAMVAGLWPLVAATGAAVARTVGEAALVAGPIVAATALLGRKQVPAAGWWAAGGFAICATAAVTVRLDTAALASLWAVGVTLALPAVAYVAAAAAVGLVVGAWATDPARRARLAGLALLAVAGLQPAFVHHSLTGLLAVALLALPAGPLDRKVAA